jgi:hypothetical protein
MNDAKAFFNLEVLKTARSFSFYTTSRSKARWSLQENVTLKDFFDYKKPGHAFKLTIIALASNLGAIIECRDCQPVSSMLTSTPIGTMQAYTLKYADVKYEKLAAYQQHNR